MTTLKTAIIETTVTITAMSCPVCGVHYGLDEGFRIRALNNGHSWYCTNGHTLSYNETEADRLRKEKAEIEARWERDKRWAREAQDELLDSLNNTKRELTATKGQLTKTRNRVAAGVCPDCNRHFVNVERHMATKHGGPGESLGRIAGEGVPA